MTKIGLAERTTSLFIQITRTYYKVISQLLYSNQHKTFLPLSLGIFYLSIL